MLIFLPSCSQRLSDCYLPMQYLKCSVFSIWVNNGCSLHTQTLTPNVEGTQLFGTSPHLKSDLFTSLALLFSVSSLRKKETHLVVSKPLWLLIKSLTSVIVVSMKVPPRPRLCHPLLPPQPPVVIYHHTTAFVFSHSVITARQIMQGVVGFKRGFMRGLRRCSRSPVPCLCPAVSLSLALSGCLDVPPCHRGHTRTVTGRIWPIGRSVETPGSGPQL